MKVVFALTVGDSDVYLRMAMLAIASIRQTNPSVSISVGVDKLSLKIASDQLIRLKRMVDDFWTVETPEGSSLARNRWVKIFLDRLIEGSFLYLDADVLVRGPLDELFEDRKKIGLEWNMNRKNFVDSVGRDKAIYDGMSWSPGNVFWNGGVIFFPEERQVGELAERWGLCWKAVREKLGVSRDQAALNHAIQSCQIPIRKLGWRYNLQVKATIHHLSEALVWHYYGCSHTPLKVAAECVAKNPMVKERELSKKAEELRLRKHPFTRDSFVSRWLLRRMVRRGKYGGWEKNWFTGDARRKVALEGARAGIRKVGRGIWQRRD